MRVRSAAAALLFLAASARAQSDPPGTELGRSAAMRFPQPVRVGDLPGRAVLQPVESQAVLGTVRSIVQDRTGRLLVVIELKRWFGLTTRTVAVPIEAMVLVGDTVAIVAYTPEQLWAMPVFDMPDLAALAADATVKVGLAKPSH